MNAVTTIKHNCTVKHDFLKGTVSRDFRPLILWLTTFYLGPFLTLKTFASLVVQDIRLLSSGKIIDQLSWQSQQLCGHRFSVVNDYADSISV